MKTMQSFSQKMCANNRFLQMVSDPVKGFSNVLNTFMSVLQKSYLTYLWLQRTEPYLWDIPN